MPQSASFLRALASGFVIALAPLASAQDQSPQEPPPVQPADPAASPQPAEQPPAADLPSAESLFERHIEAIGGKDTIFAITSRRASGTVKVYTSGQEQPVQSGILRLNSKDNGTYTQEIIFPGQSTSIRYYDGKAGWVVSDTGAASLMNPEELERITVAARIRGEADYQNHFRSYRTIDKQPLPDGDNVFIVEVTHFSGRTEALLFSENSGLLLGIIGVRKTSPDQQQQFRRSYEEYTDFGDGIKVPKIVREAMGNFLFEMSFNAVETNVDIPDPVRPEGIPDADLSAFQK